MLDILAYWWSRLDDKVISASFMIKNSPKKTFIEKIHTWVYEKVEDNLGSRLI